MKSPPKHKIKWIDSGRPPSEPPDPAYPRGIELDVSAGASPSCVVLLPYPAPRCGMFFVKCQDCQTSALVTTAGRPDDPRSIRLPCRVKYDS